MAVSILAGDLASVLEWSLGAMAAVALFMGTRLWRFATLVAQVTDQQESLANKLDTLQEEGREAQRVVIEKVDSLRIENVVAHDAIAQRLERHENAITENRVRLEELKDRVVRLPWLGGGTQRKGEE